MKDNEITCPHVGESGGCDECTLGLESMTCQEEKADMDVNHGS